MKINQNLLTVGLMLGTAAVVLLGLPAEAFANGANNLGTVTDKMTSGIQNMPKLINYASYTGGAAFGVAGILKLKQHVDNPGSVAMKDGVMRLAAAGGLLALPVMTNTIQNTMFTDRAASGFVQLPNPN
jgi:hypothetical protein